MKKPTSLPNESAAATPTTGVLRQCPLLNEFLTDPMWDDGTPRALPTFLLFRDSGSWKACLSDRAMDRVAFITGTTVDEVFAAAEKGLSKDSLDWRPAKHDRGRKGGQ
jgi:hypothetical protein